MKSPVLTAWLELVIAKAQDQAEHNENSSKA